MALVMAGLIIVQTNSLKQAADIKADQFNNQVNRALAQVIDKLESNETRIVQRLVNYNTMPSLSPVDIGNLPPGQGSLSITYFEQNYFGNYREKLQFSYNENSEGQEGENRQNMDFSSSAFDALLQQNLQRMRARERNINYQASLMEMRNIQSKSIEERVDSTILVSLLDHAMEDCGIEMEYKYAVKSFQHGQEKVIFGSPGFEHNHKNTIPGLLFPRDIDERQPNYLYVYFPKQSSFLIKATGIMVIPSLILTGLLIAIFVYSIMIIFRQKKLSAIKNDFINNMTHELKTPISTISLASQMLEDSGVSNTPRTISHVAKVINQESKRLSFQVEKVLQMAVFNEGRLKLRFKEININDLATKVAANFEIRVKSESGKLLADINAVEDEIKGDEVHITNVIFNLLDNAVKYSKDAPQIKLSTETKKDFAVISVKDNGIGIPKEHQSQIFERFYRVPTGNVHDVKGFGLGLSYVKKIVDVHKGRIKVDSAANKGTKFSLYFPLNTK